MRFETTDLAAADDWIDIALAVLIWMVPVILLALRGRVPAGSVHAALFATALFVASGIAVLASLPLFDLVDPRDSVYPLALAGTSWSCAAIVAGIYGFGAVRRARSARLRVR